MNVTATDGVELDMLAKYGEDPPDDPYADYQASQENRVPNRQPGNNPTGHEEPRYQFTPGGSFILDTDPTPVPVWGKDDQVAWADGEALMVAAAQGLGKTTLMQQLTLGRCGFPEYASLLGLPIMPGHRRVLYLAMGRPKQIARSFRRMVTEGQRDMLNDRLLVWQGPPPGDLASIRGCC